jgi:hypothetical protein
MYNLKEIRTRADWYRYAKIVETTNWSSFTSHPDWLRGYELVPFLIRKVGYFIYNEDNQEIGGLSGIKYWLGKWIIIYMSDPVYFVNITDEEKKRVWRKVLDQSNNRTHISTTLELDSLGLKRSKFPKGIYPNPGIGAVDFNISEEEYLKALKYGVRRKINQGKQDDANLIFSTVSHKKELFAFYNLLKLNALNAGYKIRPYLLLRNFWINGLRNKTIIFLKLSKNEKLVGCSVLIKSGNMINYVMGASDKTFQKLNAGYLLHLKSMEISRNFGYGYYNISIGGTQTVEKLKDDFGREKVNLTKQYVSILNK